MKKMQSNGDSIEQPTLLMEVQIGTTNFGTLIESTKADHMPPSGLATEILSMY